MNEHTPAPTKEMMAEEHTQSTTIQKHKPHDTDKTDADGTGGDSWAALWKRQVNLAVPIAAMNVLTFGRMVMSVAFLGRQGELSLAGGTLALTFANVTGFSLLTGLADGMDAICSQAVGAGNEKLLGATLYRGIAMLGVASLPIALLWWHAHRLLLLLRVDTEIAATASTYLRFLLPDLAATCVTLPLRVYMRSQGLTPPMMVAAAVAAAMHVPVNLLLRRFGLAGTAVAVWLSDFNFAAMLAAYAAHAGLLRRTHDPAASWLSGGAARAEAAALLRLSAASCMSTCLEWWCFEILVVLTGLLPQPTTSLSALAVALNADQILYSLQLSLSAAASTAVGVEVGRGRAATAAKASGVALGQGAVAGAAAAAAMVGGRRWWVRLFMGGSAGVAVRTVAEQAMATMGVMQLVSYPLTMAGGVLRGTARPAVAAYLNMAAYYLFGLPSGAALAFAWHLGVFGMLLGVVAGVSACCVASVTVVLRTDWPEHTLLCSRLSRPSAADDDDGVRLEEAVPLKQAGALV